MQAAKAPFGKVLPSSACHPVEVTGEEPHFEPHPATKETGGQAQVPPLNTVPVVMGISDKAPHVPRGGRRAEPWPLQVLPSPQQEALTHNAPLSHIIEPHQ